MSGITIALFLVTKQTAVLLTGGALLLCALEMCIRDRNKVIVLEDKADVAAAKDGKLFVVHLRQFFDPDNHIARSRDVQPAHHVKQSRLAAAGGSHNGHKFAVLHGEVHTVKGAGDVRLCAVILFQINRL